MRQRTEKFVKELCPEQRTNNMRENVQVLTGFCTRSGLYTHDCACRHTHMSACIGRHIFLLGAILFNRGSGLIQLKDV
jgi:hypothetical protein